MTKNKNTFQQFVEKFNYISSEYNDFEVAIKTFDVRSDAFIYDKENDALYSGVVVAIIKRSDDPEYYDRYAEDRTVVSAEEFFPDEIRRMLKFTISAEFITDSDCAVALIA